MSHGKWDGNRRNTQKRAIAHQKGFYAFYTEFLLQTRKDNIEEYLKEGEKACRQTNTDEKPSDAVCFD